MQAKTTVVIIGSGVSGAKAAHQIASEKRGVNIIVLEAADYIGGRTHSTPIKLANQSTFYFDLGASWIHQSSGKHPITRLVKETGLQSVETDEDKHSIWDSTGKQIPQKDFNNEYDEYKKMLKKLENSDKDWSVYDGFVKKCPQKLQSSLFMQMVAFDIEFETSAAIKDLSAWEAYNDDEFDGSQQLILNGYNKVSEYLLKESGARVFLNHKVKRVLKIADGSEILCENGAIFRANKVIIAVPLGALKKGDIKFEPALPGEKVAAIQRMGVGNVCKILLEFDKPITTSKQHYFTVLSENPKESGLATFFMNINALNQKPLLMTFGLGESSDVAQQMPEDKLRKILVQRIKAFAEVQVNENSFKLYRSSWRNNSLFGGAYSYPRVGCTYNEYEALARPVFQNDWHFCGEHTTCRYRSTVHGAYLSGMYTAKNLYKSAKDWEYFDYQWHLSNKD